MPEPNDHSQRLFVTYLRVSTKQQGRSQLGLEGQRLAIQRFLAEHQGIQIAEFEEVESGRKSVRHRPQLQAALALCRRKRATLIVARLDRLARNVVLVSQLIESGVRFLAADLPIANEMIVQILAAVAEYEANLIAERRRAAMDAMRKRGQPIGFAAYSVEERHKLRAMAELAKREKRLAFVKEIVPFIADLRDQGITSYKAIGHALNTQGVRTSSGHGKWYFHTVKNLLRESDPNYRPAPRVLSVEQIQKFVAGRRAAAKARGQLNLQRHLEALAGLAAKGITKASDVVKAFGLAGNRCPRGGSWSEGAVHKLRLQIRRDQGISVRELDAWLVSRAFGSK